MTATPPSHSDRADAPSASRQARYQGLLKPLSFPSGHASMSAIVFLTLGAVIASSRGHLTERANILLTAILMTALVGLSRILLGAHYATDVFGGWAFGSAWAMVWLVLARQLDRP